MKVLVIIPARGGSKRIPGKNIKKFLGNEMISYPIKAALSCEAVSRIIVSTDSSEIKMVAEKFGAEVPFMRSAKTSDDYATTFDVIREVVDNIDNIEDYDFICCLYPTSVFVTDKILDDSFNKISLDSSDGAVSVLEYSHPIQRALKISKSETIESIYPEYYNSRSQDLEPTYHDAGQFYIFKLSNALNEKKLITKNMSPVIIPNSQAQDIDTEDDWTMAEIKYKYCLENEKR